MRRLLEYNQRNADFQSHVLQSLGEIKGAVGEVRGRQLGVIDTLNSHSHILRQHARDIAKIRASHKDEKDGRLWTDVALQLWSKVILGVILLAIAVIGNLAPERIGQLMGAVLGTK